MISKLAVHSSTRIKAIDSMINALQQYYITGVDHNIAFLISTLKNKDFKSGNISTNFIKENYPKGYNHNHGINKSLINRFQQVAVFIYKKLNTSVDTHKISVISDKLSATFDTEIDIASASFSMTLNSKNKETHITSKWKINEKIMFINIDNELFFIKINKIHNFNKYSLTIEDCSLDLLVTPEKNQNLFDYMPEIKIEDLSKKLISPMPGLIKSVGVKKGQLVKRGDELVIIEAMKMENILKSEKDCTIEDVFIEEGSNVSTDEVLMTFK